MWPFDAPYSISYRRSIATDSLSPAIFEMLGRKHIGVTTLTFHGHVTSSITWRFDSLYGVSYWCSIATKSLSPSVHRKCYMGHQMVTWPMTSRDPKRSRSWPRYIWSQISRKRLEIGIWFQQSTNRKPHMGNRIVTWSMISRDLERWRSWPQEPNISKTAGNKESVTMERL